MGEMRQGISAELMLLNWNESANTGCKLIFEISADELEPFKSLRTRAGKKVAGQRFAAVLVLIDDDESVVPVETGKPVDADALARGEIRPAKHGGFSDAVGQRARLAVKWCDDADFQQWLFSEFTDEVKKLSIEGQKISDLAKAVLCEVCGISSRNELDTDAHAWETFCNFVRAPYMDHQSNGVPA